MSVDPLVSPDWLQARLDAPDLRIIDATWFLPTEHQDAREAHARARIPRALFFDIDEIADTASPLPHMLPSPATFAARMRALGVGDGAQIVVYDAQGIFSAARVWWTFRAMGHTDVQVLDGGLPAWIAAGGEIEEGPASIRQERHFTARLNTALVRTLPEMRKIVAAGTAQVLDARPPARFAGAEPEPRPGLRGGRMPGALNVPAAALLEAGRMKSPEALRATFAEAGVDLSAPVVCTCGSGVTAAVVALALARLGRWDCPVYDGAWAEWGALADTPVVMG